MNFESRFKKLNKEQKKAVQTTEGPVMVVAGPGTGKTEIIGMRAAYICKEGIASPENILITTFTDSGVLAIKKRLTEIMGKEGYDVNVFTIHGFCSNVISENPEKFSLKKDLRSISDVEQQEIIFNILNDINSKYFKAEGKYNSLYKVKSAISDLKKEDISTEDFERKLEEFKKQLDSEYKVNPKTEKPYGDWQKKEELYLKNKDFLEIYKSYQKTLKENGFYDYDDMIIFVIKKFKEDDDLLAKYQEQYLYIMLDEYQDTNNAQNDVVSLLVSFFSDDKPNIFVVGDDDQSIYRFQGASLENVLFFSDKYNIKNPIVLKENYRSTQNILDASFDLISNNKNRISDFVEGIDKKLHSNKEVNDKINLFSFSFEDAEVYFLYKEIKKLIEEDKVLPEDIAIFARKNVDVHAIAEFLDNNGIPVSFEAKNDILKGHAVKMFLSFLNVIENPTDDSNLYFVLGFDFLNINTKDVYKVLSKFNKINYSKKEKISLFDIISNDEILNELELENKDAINTFLDKVLKYKKLSSQMTLSAFCDEFLRDSGLLNWIYKSDFKVSYLKHISTLFSFIKNLNLYESDISLKEFLEKINLYKKYNVAIKEDGFLMEKDGVHVMTAHKSKGLEFKYVFIVKANDGYWSKIRDNNNKIKLIDNLLNISSKINFEKIEDERRLFFVAMTRAKEKLYITFSKEKKDENGNLKNLLPTQFIEEIDKDFFNKKDINFDFEDQEVFLNKKINTKKIEEENDYIKELLKNDYKINPTHLNNYLKCPKMFKYRNLLRVPSAKGKNLAMGTAFHTALERFFLEYKNTGALPSKEFLISAYNTALDYEILTHKEKEELINKGKDGLSGYYDKYADSMIIPEEIEYNFSSHDVYLGDIHLTGQIDKVEKIDDNSVKVIDYKTGDVKSTNDVEGKTKGSDGSLKRQLLFYKILCDLDNKFKYNATVGEIDFVLGKNGRYEKRQIFFEEKDIEDLKKLIKDVYEKIMNLEFECNNKKGHCDNCKDYLF